MGKMNKANEIVIVANKYLGGKECLSVLLKHMVGRIVDTVEETSVGPEPMTVLSFENSTKHGFVRLAD